METSDGEPAEALGPTGHGFQMGIHVGVRQRSHVAVALEIWRVTEFTGNNRNGVFHQLPYMYFQLLPIDVKGKFCRS